MKSPFGWCVIVAVLLALRAGTAAAQSDGEKPADDGSLYQLAEPFSFCEPACGFRVQADALIWTRSNSGGSGPVIGGPESFSSGSLSNSFVGGYRIGAAWLIDPNYEVEAVWMTFADWTAITGGILNRAISFNNGQASPLVDPSGHANFINTGTFFRPVYDAAIDPMANPAIQNYAFMQGGSTYALYSTSTLSDVQANFKTRRPDGQRFSYGIGYRNVRLNEGTTAVVSGLFGTSDLPAGGNVHNVLTNDALTKHGLTAIGGAADGWSNTLGNPTSLSLLWNGTTTNQLNGLQGTVDAALLRRGPFALEGLLRTGLFYNRITGSVREVYTASGGDNSTYGRSFSDQRDVVSFVANLGLNGVYSFNDFVKFRTGYEIMFLTNAALSGNQQQGISYNGLGNASYSVQGGSSVFFHGVRAGLEVVW